MYIIILNQIDVCMKQYNQQNAYKIKFLLKYFVASYIYILPTHYDELVCFCVLKKVIFI